MGLWTMIFWIAVAGMIFAAWKHHTESKLGIVRDEEGNPVRDLRRESDLQREVQDLRERIKVLERIATDDRGPRQLASEIEELRNK